MTVENLTACNFLEGDGSAGNQIWFNFGDGSGRSVRGAFRGAYLNATSTYYATGKPAASYGIFSSNTRGPGTFAHTYASNMNDASYYIGACVTATRCSPTGTRSTARSATPGPTPGGHLIVENSEWDHNQSGIVTNSQNNDDAPSPQLGLCPGSTSRSCTFFRNNYVHDNNNPNVPSAGSAALGPVGSGIIVSGGRFDTVTHNRVVEQRLMGHLARAVPRPRQAAADRALPGRDHQRPGARLLLRRLGATPSRTTRFTHNGFFANPTNGDVGGDQRPAHARQLLVRQREHRRHADHERAARHPVDARHLRRAQPGRRADAARLAAPADLRHQLLGPCPPSPGMAYPRTHAGRDAAAPTRLAHDAQSVPRRSRQRLLRAPPTPIHGLTRCLLAVTPSRTGRSVGRRRGCGATGRGERVVAAELRAALRSSRAARERFGRRRRPSL